MNKKYIKTITFDEIINQALEKKEEIANEFLNRVKGYGIDYPYYTLIADFNHNGQNQYYITFIVDSENENGYIEGFNLKLITLGKDEYREEEWTKKTIIEMLEEKLNELKEMTTPKNKD